MRGALLITGLCVVEPKYLHTIYDNLVKPNNLDVYVYIDNNDPEKSTKYFQQIFQDSLKFIRFFNNDEEFIYFRNKTYSTVLSRMELMIYKYGYETMKQNHFEDFSYEDVRDMYNKSLYNNVQSMDKMPFYNFIDQYIRLSFAAEKIRNMVLRTKYDFFMRWRPDFTCENTFDLSFVKLKERYVYVVPCRESDWKYGITEYFITDPYTFLSICIQFVYDMFIYLPDMFSYYDFSPEMQMGQYMKKHNFITYTFPVKFDPKYYDDDGQSYYRFRFLGENASTPFHIGDFNKKNHLLNMDNLAKLNNENKELPVEHHSYILLAIFGVLLFLVVMFKIFKLL